jgi:MinD superfamily P-loop ATPase
MSNSKQISINQNVNTAAVATEKRVILSMGGKGGVGKTSVMAGLAEWFEENEIPVKLLDLDTENKARGSLTHFFGGSVREHPHGRRARFIRRPTGRRSACDSRGYGRGSRPSHL